MNIAIDIRSLTAAHKTGVGVVTESVIRAMAHQSPNDHFVLFSTGTQETLMNIPVFRELNITVVPLSLPNKLASALWTLPHGPTMERFLPTLPDAWLFPHAHVCKTALPYVVLFHDAALRAAPECFTWKDHLRAKATNEEKVFLQAKRVIAVSEHSKNDASHFYGIPEERITVAPLGVDHAVYAAREQSQDRSYRAAYDLNHPYLLALATREPRKNLESVVLAYTQFRSRSTETLPLVLAGTTGWKTRALDAAIRTSPYSADIRELSYVPEKHKAALLRGATTLLFPSFYEGFGLPVLEAMACGTPVITSISSSLPDVTGNAALLIDPLNITDIANALHQIIEEPHGTPLRALLRKRGTERAQHFSWKKTGAVILDALHHATQKY